MSEKSSKIQEMLLPFPIPFPMPACPIKTLNFHPLDDFAAAPESLGEKKKE